MAQYSYKTRLLQSVYDLSVQLYGDVSKIGILLELFPNLNNAISLNSNVNVDNSNDPIAKYFLDNSLIVATDVVGSVDLTVDDTTITVDSDSITSDQTIY